jgi:hypothetical protein
VAYPADPAGFEPDEHPAPMSTARKNAQVRRADGVDPPGVDLFGRSSGTGIGLTVMGMDVRSIPVAGIGTAGTKVHSAQDHLLMCLDVACRAPIPAAVRGHRQGDGSDGLRC